MFPKILNLSLSLSLCQRCRKHCRNCRRCISPRSPSVEGEFECIEMEPNKSKTYLSLIDLTPCISSSMSSHWPISRLMDPTTPPVYHLHLAWLGISLSQIFGIAFQIWPAWDSTIYSVYIVFNRVRNASIYVSIAIEYFFFFFEFCTI